MIAASVSVYVQRLRLQPAALSLRQKLRAVGGAQLGMLVAHAGVGIFIIGVTGVQAFETEQDLRMRPAGAKQRARGQQRRKQQRNE